MNEQELFQNIQEVVSNTDTPLTPNASEIEIFWEGYGKLEERRQYLQKYHEENKEKRNKTTRE